MSAPVRILVASGSAPMLQALCYGLSAQGLELVAAAGDGGQAVDLARSLRPDVVLLDERMPRLDGLGAARRIMAASPSRVLLVTGARGEAQVRLAVEATAAGALELVPGPAGGADMGRWIQRLAQTVRLMSEVPVVTRHEAPAPGSSLGPLRQIAAVGLVASTGGPQALATILAGLPPGLSIPVIAVQHMPPGFVAGLVHWLSGLCPLPVVEAVHGGRCAAGRVYFAPDGFDLRVEPPGRFRLSTAASGFFSSGNALLESLADAYGARAAGAVLSGMGDDGAAGLLRIRRAGGVTLAQSAATCAVFGMPGAAVQCGATRELLEPEAIRSRIVRLAGRQADHCRRGG